MKVIQLAREAHGKLVTKDYPGHLGQLDPWTMRLLERFAALVRADLMKQVMDICEAEYKRYDEMVFEDDTGHEEATAMIHLMRKLEKLK